MNPTFQIEYLKVALQPHDMVSQKLLGDRIGSLAGHRQSNSDAPVSEDPLPLVTTVRLRIANFIARHKPFLADFKVPQSATEGICGHSLIVLKNTKRTLTVGVLPG
jgi:hypothetical protein